MSHQSLNLFTALSLLMVDTVLHMNGQHTRAVPILTVRFFSSFGGPHSLCLDAIGQLI
jgi:hypothetical protein